MVPAMGKIIAFGARKDAVEDQRLKVVFGGLARFCEVANGVLSEQPAFSLSWRDGKSDIRAAVNSRRMFEIFLSVVESDAPRKKISDRTPSAREAVCETIEILKVHRSAAQISALAKQAFSMPTGVADAPTLTMDQKRRILEDLRFTELSIFLS